MKRKNLKLTIALLAMLGLQTIAEAKGLVMGLIPAENNEEMIQKFEPMRQFLEQKTGEPIKVFTATDYAGVIEGMKKGRVDIAWFGALVLCAGGKRGQCRSLRSRRALGYRPIDLPLDIRGAGRFYGSIHR